MIRILWIPVTGTIAALIAIALTHSPREDQPASSPARRTTPEDLGPLPESDRPDAPGLPVDEGGEPDEGEAEAPGPARDHYLLRLRADGSLVDSEDKTEYRDAAAVIAALAPPGARRVTVTVTNDSDEVSEAALDALREQLQTKVDFRKDYRAPEKEPDEDDEEKEK